ncbi:glycosyltransferase family 2 protein [Reichenbachiella versicolor]|uniref:glycosyltransferase family 2 protein n=1 Tax=Reichenbachiella versicolor TaxID=1821036 RepID=UPI000D6E3CE2|nr:glycosyltransferase family 2 protein [Reichenbachiella versicolor]
MESLFIICLAIVFYTYLGYGIVLFILTKLKRALQKESPREEFQELPTVSLLVAAYNEESVIEAKIQNALALDYPKDKLQVLFVTDGTTDGTNEIIKAHPEVKLFYSPERKGKIHAVNRVMPMVDSDITIYSDANVHMNKEAVSLMVDHFSDHKVGAVSGEKTVWSDTSDKASAAGEGLYWKYESYLKRKDAELNTLVGAAGELFAIRTSLYETVSEDSIIEDFMMTVGIAAKGYKVAYEKNAVALESASASIEDEQKRKVRIAAGGIQSIVRLRSLLNPFKHGMLTFQYISHRVLRWTLTPLCLPVLLLANIALVQAGTFYQLMMLGQILFYTLASVGFFLRRRKIRIKIFYIPYYFLFMNYCVILGWQRYFKNNQSVVWEKAQRVVVEESKMTTTEN